MYRECKYPGRKRKAPVRLKTNALKWTEENEVPGVWDAIKDDESNQCLSAMRKGVETLEEMGYWEEVEKSTLARVLELKLV